MLNGFILFKIYVIFGYIYTIIFESAAKHCFIILYIILDIKKILATSYFSYSLSSAFRCLTSVFGMGTGVTSLLLSPHIILSVAHSKLNISCVKLPFLETLVKCSTY